MFKVYVDGTGQITGALAQVRGRVSDAKSAWEIAGQYFKGRVLRDAFGAEADLYGERWKPLSKATIAARRKGKGQGRTLRILQDTGLLRGSITYKADGRGVVVGTNVKYGRNHQAGVGVKGQKLPKRAFLYEAAKGLPGQDKTRLGEILLRYFTTGKAR